MTEEKIAGIVEKLRKIKNTNFSDYAGFKLNKSNGGEFHTCFILNNESFYSSNYTTQVDNIEDAISIIRKLTGQDRQQILKELNNNGSYFKEDGKIFLHYLKLTRKCEE